MEHCKPSCGESKCDPPKGAGYTPSTHAHPAKYKQAVISEPAFLKFRYNAEPVRVTILGYPKPSNTAQTGMEQFEAATGYHIRTIPPDRFNNPTKVATGGGFMAVVESYATTDLIRITDYHVGAPLEVGVAWDANGIPVPGFNWSGVADIDQVNVASVLANGPDYGVDQSSAKLTASTPRIAGIGITPYGLVIAALEGTPTILIWDIKGAQVDGTGKVVPQYARWCGAFVLPNVFANARFKGAPICHDIRKTSTFYRFAIAADWADTGGTTVLVIDAMKSIAVGAFPGPQGTSIGAVLSGNVLNHFVSTKGATDLAGNPIADQIARSCYTGDDFFACGVLSDTQTPTPAQQALTKTFTVLDPFTDNPTMSAVNKGAYLQDHTWTTQEASAQLPISPGRDLPAGSSTESLGPGTQTVTEQTISNYTKPFVMNQAVINITNYANLNIISANGINNIVGYMRNTPGALTTKPYYDLLHGTHADWLADGGGLYGCINPDGSSTTQVITSGMQPIYIAIDRSAEPGTLGALPDVKIGLFDIGTNLMVYAGAKSLGYRYYGGESAGLALSSDYDSGGVSATTCTINEDMLIEQYDGVAYTYDRNDPAHPASGTFDMRQQSFGLSQTFPGSITNTDDGRFPWVLFVPRATPTDKFSVTPTDDRAMATVDEDGHPLPWWGTPETQNPVQQVVAVSQFMVQAGAGTSAPTFNTDGGGGFFGLNWTKTTPDGSTYTTPPSILQAKLGPVQETPAGTDDDGATPVQDDVEDILPLNPLFPGVTEGDEPQRLAIGTNVGENPTLERVVAFDTDIRSIVGITVNLDAQDNAFENYRVPEYAANGIGNPVAGDANAIHDAEDYSDLGISNSFAYDAGDTAFGGAVALYEIEVLFNGQPSGFIARYAASAEEIEGRAPAEAQDVLQEIFGVDNDNNTNPDAASYIQGRVWFSEEVIETVTVNVKLINYGSDVFRVGFQNLNFNQATTLDPDGYHFGPDPGFLDGINCAADLFGNTECLSFILFGSVKLLSTDPIRPLVGNVVWQGSATYKMKDPYATRGQSVGHLFIINFTFDLNAGTGSYKINFRNGYDARALVFPNL